MDSTYEQVEKVINKLRPYLNRNEGDIHLIDIKDGIVYVKMLGACAGCSFLDETLKDGVEQILMEEVPGVLEVRSVEEPLF
ncbi:NifU family protein [uncultured Thomasclavelia sp.]|uniref:NifU family protein n=1 Tax=uncultured Thomasclavelia sp. TaxID=3025759 RepID=UPI0025CCE74D|nr:NifU family protein [uncultured Thomasclavelia sp.]